MLSTITDKKVYDDVNADNTADYSVPEIVSQQDYYPFGMLMPERSLSLSNYRFGFNGKENDDEAKGEGNWQDYGMRVYDTRLGRFPSVDPITKEYPSLTPYQFASNRTIDGIDRDGLEWSQIIPQQAFLSSKIRQPHSEQQASEWAIEGIKMYAEALGQGALLLAPIEELATAGFGKLAGIFGKSSAEIINAGKISDKLLEVDIASVKTVNPKELNITHEISGNASSRGVGDYMNKIQNGEEIEPIKVAEINNQDFILDGHHRTEAAKRLNTTLEAQPVVPNDYPSYGYKSAEEILNANANAGKNKLNSKIVNEKASKNCYVNYDE